ncbi:MAG: RDD family protein [Proteobacteria bacterium]|nr:RDD family protein [Pseudomonadota bacterium]MBU1389235.1 RDD family protein [Pseudomonadota bacterium]MBU1544799.1 RDD family protein [Pseudomonadota bacterium]MBU2430745.1 RDD family protein [Pseudomonadota bacterium]
MEWYYVVGKEQNGPVDENTFEDLCMSKTITDQTLVWNKTMTDWQPWDQVKHSTVKQVQNPDEYTPQNTGKLCTECGKAFPDDELVAFQGSLICASCKPVFLQKIREGVSTARMVYAGFWIRFAAKFIDMLILWVINMIFAFITSFFIPTIADNPENMAKAMIPSIIIGLINAGINVFYVTWFVGKHSATPGKMVCGLKIVSPQNTKISYWRAFGRCFAEILSAIILYIGYIMAGFDEEKRALHDRICATRVIRK